MRWCHVVACRAASALSRRVGLGHLVIQHPRWFAGDPQGITRIAIPPGIEVSPVSRQVCRHRGTKLPDNQTCGGLCEQFPSCLPALPPQVVGRVVTLRTEAASVQRATAALAGSLELLYDAIVKGLTRKDHSERPQ
jgi:hypothetical protein